jgi:hypothetical protein
MFTKKSTTTAAIPRLDEVEPTLVTERARQASIQAAAAELTAETAHLRAEITKGTASNGQNVRVAAILAGVETVSAPSEPLKELGAMLSRLHDFAAANEAQYAKIRALENDASLKLCNLVRERFDGLVASICTKLVEAHEMNAELTHIVDSVERQGASTGSLPKFLAHKVVGNPRDRHSALGSMLREAKQHGFIKVVPEAFV